MTPPKSVAKSGTKAATTGTAKPAKAAKASAPVAVKSSPPKSASSSPRSTSSDWRAAALERLRALILASVPGIEEEQKWKKPSNPTGVPVWSCHGILCTGETYKNYVKLTFMKGAALPDPAGLFNAGQGGGTRRAIDLKEGETVDARAFTALIRAAAALNAGTGEAQKKGSAPRARKGK